MKWTEYTPTFTSDQTIWGPASELKVYYRRRGRKVDSVIVVGDKPIWMTYTAIGWFRDLFNRIFSKYHIT